MSQANPTISQFVKQVFREYVLPLFWLAVLPAFLMLVCISSESVSNFIYESFHIIVSTGTTLFESAATCIVFLLHRA